MGGRSVVTLRCKMSILVPRKNYGLRGSTVQVFPVLLTCM